MTFPFGETVTHIRRQKAAQPDSDGNDAYDEDPVDIEKVAVAPWDGNATAGNENVQGRDTVVIGYLLSLPAGKIVSAVDRFRVRGELCDVQGKPEALHSPFTGWNPGLPVTVKRVTG